MVSVLLADGQALVRSGFTIIPRARDDTGSRDMARRAAEIGATVTLGPLDDGGFQVRARLPR